MPCPICHKPTHADFTPFCSKRCADVDLNRWFTGQYAVPDNSLSEDEDNLDEMEGEDD